MNVSYLYMFSVSRCWMSYYKTQQYSLGQPLSLQPLLATIQHKITAWVKPLSLHVNKITAWVQPLSLHVNYELDWITATCMLVVCVCHGLFVDQLLIVTSNLSAIWLVEHSQCCTCTCTSDAGIESCSKIANYLFCIMYIDKSCNYKSNLGYNSSPRKNLKF